MTLTLPKTTTPAALAKELGWSERRVRAVARRAGHCLVLGNRMIFLERDVAAMEAIANGETAAPEPQPRRHKGSFVYLFAQREFVKIGWSDNWKQRLLTLQRGSPTELVALAVYRGGPAHERKLHEMFAEHRERSEWFRDCDAIREYVKANKRNCLVR